MTGTIRSLLAEPRPTPPPPLRVWRDWALVFVVVVFVVLEVVVRQDLVLLPVNVGLALVLPVALMFRRSHPLISSASVFTVAALINIATLAGGTNGSTFYTMAFVLILPYSLFRWASGREVAFGSILMLVSLISGLAADPTTLGETIAGIVIFLFPAVLGGMVRFWMRNRMRELDDVRMREREQLARELHDAVAHHVSAIAIRAQAGQALAPTSPEAALDALRVVEREASATLAEVRSIVGVLRADEAAELTPQQGIRDIHRLAEANGDSAVVEVDMSGPLAVAPSVGSAIYRIAQESVTNARRHSTDATKIRVHLSADDTSVHLRIEDDGRPVGPNGVDGFGIQGMKERAELLGGKLSAGPKPGGGWVVSAELPRDLP